MDFFKVKHLKNFFYLGVSVGHNNWDRRMWNRTTVKGLLRQFWRLLHSHYTIRLLNWSRVGVTLPSLLIENQTS